MTNYKHSKLKLVAMLLFAMQSVFFIVLNQQVRAGSQSPFFTPSDENFFTINSPETLELSGTTCPNIYPSRCAGPFCNLIHAPVYLMTGANSQPTDLICLGPLDGATEVGEVDGVKIYAFLNEDNNKGLTGSITTAAGKILESRPASGKEYFESQIYALKNFGTVNAQSTDAPYYPGTGFSLLNPIQGFWGWSVNIVYGLMIFIIIGVAFGIMFRAKLPDGTAIALQTAIPNIAMAMILIPLSYAICGLAIDSVTLGTNIVRNFLIGQGAPARIVYDFRNCSDEEENNILDNAGNPTTCTGREVKTDRGLYPDDARLKVFFGSSRQVDLSDEATAAVYGLGEFGNDIQSDAPAFVKALLTILDILPDDKSDDNGTTNTTINAAGNSWIGDIINFFIQIFLFVTSIRILIRLLKKYVVFLVAPIFAPFVFATVAIPGNGTKAIMNFIKLLGSAALFYIVTYGLFLLAIIFSRESFAQSVPDLQGGLYVPPMLGLDSILRTASSSSLTSVNAVMFGFIALVIYAGIPKTLDNIDESMGTAAVMPKFLTDSLTSAKDTVNFAKNAKNMAVTAVDKYNPYDMTIRSNRAYNATMQNIRNLADRAKGLRPGEYGSDLYNRRREIENQIDDLEKMRVDAVRRGDLVQARGLQTRINQMGRKLGGINASRSIQSDYGGGGGGGAKMASGSGGGAAAGGGGGGDGPADLKAEITWNNGPMPIAFDAENMRLLLQVLASGRNTYTFQLSGKLVLKSTGYRMPPNVASLIGARIVPARDTYRSSNPSDKRVYRTSEGDLKVKGSATAATGGVDSDASLQSGFAYGSRGASDYGVNPSTSLTRLETVFNFKTWSNFFEIKFESGNAVQDNPDGAGSTWDIKYSLVIKDIKGLIIPIFRANPATGAITMEQEAKMNSSVFLQTDRIRISIANTNKSRRSDGNQDMVSNEIALAIKGMYNLTKKDYDDIGVNLASLVTP